MAKRSSLVALSFVATFFAALGMASPVLPGPQPSTQVSQSAADRHEARDKVVIIRLRSSRTFSLVRH